MRSWDLNGPAAKLELGLRSLQEKAAEIGEAWDDPTYRRFLETYIAPVEPRVKTVLDSLHRLAEVLANAERQCRNEGAECSWR